RLPLLSLQLSLSCILSFCYSHAHPRDLHSFPTRRSSDLADGGVRQSLSDAEPRPLDRRALPARGHDLRAAAHADDRRLRRALELDRKSTRLELQSRGHLVCRLLLEKKK